MESILHTYFNLQSIAGTSDDFISESHQAIRGVLERRRLLARKIVTSALDCHTEQLVKEEIHHLNQIIVRFYNL